MTVRTARLLAPPLLPRPTLERFGSESVLLSGFAESEAPALLEVLERTVLPRAPWRHMLTPGGQRMSVAMSNCGSARLGQRPSRLSLREPAIPRAGSHGRRCPEALSQLGLRAAAAAGFAAFEPDACLINCYRPGTRLTLHQDRNERDLRRPVVSVSFGLPALFLFGGLQRARPGTAHSAVSRRCGGLGRRAAPCLSRRRAAGRGRASAHRPLPGQSDPPSSALAPSMTRRQSRRRLGYNFAPPLRDWFAREQRRLSVHQRLQSS